MTQKGKQFKPQFGKKPKRDSEDRVQEKLKSLDAHKQPGSGARLGKKGDHEMQAMEAYRFEDKTTFKTLEAKIRLGWISKITIEAKARRECPVVVLGFERLRPPIPKDWAMLPLEELVNLIKAAGGRPPRYE